MIQAIEIENFKGFSSVRVENFSKVTLLGGANNAGKSTLMEAIFLYFGRYIVEIIPKLVGFRHIPGFHLDGESIFKLFAHDFVTASPIKISLGINGITESLEIAYDPSKKKLRRLPQKTSDEKKGIMIDSPGNFTQVLGGIGITLTCARPEADPVSLELTASSSGMAFEPEPPTEERICVYNSGLGASVKDDARRYGELDKQNAAAGLLEFITEFDSSIRGFSLISILDVPIIHADVGLGEKIPVTQLGFGISRLITYYLAASAAKNGVLMIDEVDAGIYHELLPKLWKAIRKLSEIFDVQIISTSHSYECISAASDCFRDEMFAADFSFIRLDRLGMLGDGRVRATHYSASGLADAIEGGFEVR